MLESLFNYLFSHKATKPQGHKHKKWKDILKGLYDLHKDEARFENMVAVSLLRMVYRWNELGLGDFDLRYIRNHQGKEVDFLIVKDRQPLALIEAKTTQRTLSNSGQYFKRYLNIPFYQLVENYSDVDVFKNIFYPETLEKALRDFFEIGESYFQEEKGLKFLEIVIKYIYKATEIKTSKVVEAIDPITKKGGELAMTTAEKLRQEGRQEGKQEGVQLGTYNTYFNLIQNMKKNNIPEAEIAKLMNLELSIIKKIANKEEVEIPLHLLDSDL